MSLEDRDFIGKATLQTQQDNTPEFKMIGLILEGRGVLRGHQPVQLNGTAIGEITSGTFSPTLEKSIALARINSSAEIAIDDTVHVEVRNKLLQCRVVKYPFIQFK